ncbi:MAG: type II toxin-antitoxin system prevent-host-death family antitoxin [Microbacteriaceae bacterium]|nr:type II toxin-antitoxin system prevent-host-death family antitoxin [Microbacteriaceae bacterium]
MTPTISIGQLRQNPTRMLREVRAGATYVITDHGEPIAEVSPRREHRWVPATELDLVLRDLGADDAWAAQIAENRNAEHAIDPWERTR